MTWHIEIKGTDKRFQVEAGERVPIAVHSEQAPLCVAVGSDSLQEGLALIFRSQRGVSLHGRPIPCPVVAFDRRGGCVVIARDERQYVLSVSRSASPGRHTGQCLLCRRAFDGSALWQCERCAIAFHRECIEEALRCPRCNAAITRDSGRTEQ